MNVKILVTVNDRVLSRWTQDKKAGHESTDSLDLFETVPRNPGLCKMVPPCVNICPCTPIALEVIKVRYSLYVEVYICICIYIKTQNNINGHCPYQAVAFCLYQSDENIIITTFVYSSLSPVLGDHFHSSFSL